MPSDREPLTRGLNYDFSDPKPDRVSFLLFLLFGGIAAISVLIL